MTRSLLRARRMFAAGLALAAMVTLASPARADMVSRESEIVNLRLGQRVLVDDGSCPAGQIKQVTGLKLVAGGVQRTVQCIERKGARR